MAEEFVLFDDYDEDEIEEVIYDSTLEDIFNLLMGANIPTDSVEVEDYGDFFMITL